VFARYKGELGGGPERNNGEAAALDRATVEAIVDDLIVTGMRLPVSTGAALFAWAYGAGILP
jgi:hypothetical protein